MYTSSHYHPASWQAECQEPFLNFFPFLIWWLNPWGCTKDSTFKIHLNPNPLHLHVQLHTPGTFTSTNKHGISPLSAHLRSPQLTKDSILTAGPDQVKSFSGSLGTLEFIPYPKLLLPAGVFEPSLWTHCNVTYVSSRCSVVCPQSYVCA